MRKVTFAYNSSACKLAVYVDGKKVDTKHLLKYEAHLEDLEAVIRACLGDDAEFECVERESVVFPENLPIPEDSFDFKDFTIEERTLRCGMAVRNMGTEAPWLTPFGVGIVKIWDMRRLEDGTVEFGIGDEERPDADEMCWCRREDFYGEWPD